MSNQIIINNKIIYASIENILKDLKNELTNDKLQTIQIRGSNIRVSCPEHKDGLEKHPSCGIYDGEDSKIEKGTFHCFTCGTSGPLYHFIALCFNKDDNFGKKWLIDKYGIDDNIQTIDLPFINLKELKVKNYLDENILNNFQSWHPYMAKRKLTQKVCEQFEIKYDPNTKCIIFPVRDETGNLWMLTKRSTIEKKFFIENNKEKPIYLYYYIKQNNIDEITICESQINALTLWGWNIPAVALFGTGTKEQYKIINKSNLKHIYLALDGDYAGKHGTVKLINNIKKDILIDVINIPLGKDVNDLTEEEFNNLTIIDSNKWLYKFKNKYSK